MSISGELTSIIKNIDFTSKADLLNQLRNLRNDVKQYPKNERKIIMPHLAVAIQQAFYTSEWELLHYKEFLTKRSDNATRKRED